MLFFLYQLFAHLAWLVHLPILLWEMSRTGKYKSSFLQRLAVGVPELTRGHSKLVWIHAVSMGEVRAAAAMAKAMSGWDVVISTVTETGRLEAKRAIPNAAAHLFLPFDFFWLTGPLVRKIKPDLVLLCEGDFWPAFQRACKKAGASLAVVSGKLSERSAVRLTRFPCAARLLFGSISHFCLQNEEYARRFVQAGVPQRKISVAGNLKFDGEVSRLADREAWRQKLGIQKGEKVLAIGSSHHPEEEQLLDALQGLEGWKILLVPRHPERFDQVAALLKLRGESYGRFSKGETGRVVLIDAMGKLRDCYQVADVAIVAGSFTSSVGGHNIMEPLDYGVPVLFGPHMYTQQESVELVLQAQAGRQVSIEEVAEAVASTDKELGERGEALMVSLRGSVARTLKALPLSHS